MQTTRASNRGPLPRPAASSPELNTEEAELGEEQIYDAAAGQALDWRGAWVERRVARHTLAGLRAERRRLELELRLIGVFGLTRPTRLGANPGMRKSWIGAAKPSAGCAGSFL